MCNYYSNLIYIVECIDKKSLTLNMVYMAIVFRDTAFKKLVYIEIQELEVLDQNQDYIKIASGLYVPIATHKVLQKFTIYCKSKM